MQKKSRRIFVGNRLTCSAKQICLARKNKGKEIVLVGVSFSEKERNIGDWIIERREPL